MDFLIPIFEIIYKHGGMLTGGFVRDCIVRGEPVSKDKDIDVLVPFSTSHDLQSELEDKFGDCIDIIQRRIV